MEEKDLPTVTILNHKIKFWLVIEIVLVLVMVFQVLGMICFFDLFEDIKEAEKIMEVRRMKGDG